MVPIMPVEHCMSHGTTGGSTNGPNSTKLGTEAVASTRTTPNSLKVLVSELRAMVTGQ